MKKQAAVIQVAGGQRSIEKVYIDLVQEIGIPEEDITHRTETCIFCIAPENLIDSIKKLPAVLNVITPIK